MSLVGWSDSSTSLKFFCSCRSVSYITGLTIYSWDCQQWFMLRLVGDLPLCRMAIYKGSGVGVVRMLW